MIIKNGNHKQKLMSIIVFIMVIVTLYVNVFAESSNSTSNVANSFNPVIAFVLALSTIFLSFLYELTKNASGTSSQTNDESRIIGFQNNDKLNFIPVGNGIWLNTYDKDAITSIMKSISLKQYYVDDMGFVHSTNETPSNISGKSPVVTSILDSIMTYNIKTIIAYSSTYNRFLSKNNANVINPQNNKLILIDNESNDQVGDLISKLIQIKFETETGMFINGVLASPVFVENKIRTELNLPIRNGLDLPENNSIIFQQPVVQSMGIQKDDILIENKFNNFVEDKGSFNDSDSHRGPYAHEYDKVLNVKNNTLVPNTSQKPQFVEPDNSADKALEFDFENTNTPTQALIQIEAQESIPYIDDLNASKPELDFVNMTNYESEQSAFTPPDSVKNAPLKTSGGFEKASFEENFKRSTSAFNLPKDLEGFESALVKDNNASHIQLTATENQINFSKMFDDDDYMEDIDYTSDDLIEKYDDYNIFNSEENLLKLSRIDDLDDLDNIELPSDILASDEYPDINELQGMGNYDDFDDDDDDDDDFDDLSDLGNLEDFDNLDDLSDLDDIEDIDDMDDYNENIEDVPGNVADNKIDNGEMTNSGDITAGIEHSIDDTINADDDFSQRDFNNDKLNSLYNDILTNNLFNEESFIEPIIFEAKNANGSGGVYKRKNGGDATVKLLASDNGEIIFENIATTAGEYLLIIIYSAMVYSNIEVEINESQLQNIEVFGEGRIDEFKEATISVALSNGLNTIKLTNTSYQNILVEKIILRFLQNDDSLDGENITA